MPRATCNRRPDSTSHPPGVFLEKTQRPDGPRPVSGTGRSGGVGRELRRHEICPARLQPLPAGRGAFCVCRAAAGPCHTPTGNPLEVGGAVRPVPRVGPIRHFVHHAQGRHDGGAGLGNFADPALCLRLPSDSQSPTKPLPLANTSPCGASRGLSPPSRYALPAAPKEHGPEGPCSL